MNAHSAIHGNKTDKTLTISIGTDHAGFPLKAPIIAFLKARGCEVIDCGCASDLSRVQPSPR